MYDNSTIYRCWLEKICLNNSNNKVYSKIFPFALQRVLESKLI